MMGAPVLLEESRGGGLWQVVLDRPKANILDSQMVQSISDLLIRAREETGLKALCFSGIGDHFSFGASVQEHLPDQVADMLGGFHRMFRLMAETPVVLLAAVRGQCLGGGLELASFCHRVFASRDAKLGQPEIQLGVFAPVASVVLSERVGRPAAEHLCLSGQILGAEEALGIRLVDELAEDPVEAALQYYDTHLAGRSATSLGFAVRAVRHGFNERLLAELQSLEELYLSELQATHDAKEGIRAFLDKRSPEWRNE